MYAVTLSQLLLRVRQRANIEGYEEFIVDAEIIDDINQSISEWYDEVRLTTFGGQYFRAAYPFTTVPGQSLYSVAPNTASIISVDCQITGNMTIAALPYQEEMRNIYKYFPLNGWMLGQTIFYQLQPYQGQDGINFIGTPNQAYSVVINYVPTAPVLSDPSDVLNSINGWEEFIVLDAAIKCLIKDGQEDIIPLITGRLEKQRERIQKAAGQRDMNASEGVHETSQNWDGFTNF